MKRSWPTTGLILPALAMVLMTCLAGRTPQAFAQEAAPAPEAASVDSPGAEPAAEAAPAEPPAAAPGADAAAPAAETAPAGAEIKAGANLEDDFSNFLHFANMGQFEVAEKWGQSLLRRPELNPLSNEAAQELLALSQKYRNSMDLLLLMVNNTPLAETAQKVLTLVRESHARARMAPARIVDNIKLLAGTPVQQSVGLERLVESGEYAVPWMLEALADPKQADLQPFIVRALPSLGKRAVNPLVEALSVQNAAVQGVVAQALGRIGYPQALPYLQRLAADPKINPAVKTTAIEAIERIVVADPAVKRLAPDVSFRELAENYYANIDSLRPDPREDRANVWFLKDGILKPIEVPREIYAYVMSMRAAEASLALNQKQPQVVALWLAADFHREAAMGLDVESEEIVQTNDLTRPPNFPRGVYFARTAGPLHCQLTLGRAVRDRDTVVALGSITGLHATAGPASLVEPASREGISLAGALSFPDILVRIRAALALGQALPQQAFRDSAEVVPVLSSALQLTGRKVYVVVDGDATTRERIAGDLSRTGAAVVAAETFGAAMDTAHRQFTYVDAIFLASDMLRPTPVEALRALKDDARFALSPVVLVVKANGNLVLDRVAGADRRVGHVFLVAGGGAGEPDANLVERLLARRAEVAPKYGARELSPEQSVALALEAARTLQDIATNRSPVYDVSVAAPSLIQALGHPSEELRVVCAAVLAMIDSAPAQRAIGVLALSPDQSEPLRKAAFASLAESARRFGPRLEEAAMQKLMEQATREANLSLRTAASQAFGAMNPPGGVVADIILQQ